MMSIMSEMCSLCKTTKQLLPSMKLMVSECFHVMCDTCVNFYFVMGVGSCPVCKVTLRHQSFHERVFEDVWVEKDLQARKRVLRDYNKHEEDFDTLEAYNNYLEEVETIIHNLVNDIDVSETNARIRKYKEENREQIAHNRNRLSLERRELDDILAIERSMEERHEKDLAEELAEKRERDAENKEAMLDELECGKDAKKVFREYAERFDKEMEWDYMPPPKPWVLKNSNKGEQCRVWRHEIKDHTLEKCVTHNLRQENSALMGAYFQTGNK